MMIVKMTRNFVITLLYSMFRLCRSEFRLFITTKLSHVFFIGPGRFVFVRMLYLFSFRSSVNSLRVAYWVDDIELWFLNLKSILDLLALCQCIKL